MKLTKKIIAIVLVAAMIVTPWSSAKASSTTYLTYTDGHTVADGVNYEEYSIYGSSSGHTETASVLEFHPDDGYMPMAFASNAGNVTTLATQYSTAVSKYGYEVAGVINGSFFDLDTGTMEGILISGGKVSCADIGYTYGNLLDVVAFGYDGSMSIVESQLAYYMYINGTLVPDALRFINKQQSSDGWRTDAIYYYDTSCGSVADSSTYGYEVVCKKVNGTDLVVGETMVAEVIQINGYTSGSTIDSDSSIESDNFVLSTPSGSSYVSYLSGLAVGDTIEISIEETVAESKEIMENACSVITNVGCLVKDGVDLTDSTSVIGDHNVSTTYARWTAFGTKADGTYVFFTSEGGSTGDTSQSLTLKDVASAMINLGCTDVIRMDGGGSTAMYLSNTGSGSKGYAMSSSRAVADCVLVVKKTSDMELKEAIKAAEKISHTDYTAEELVAIRAAYETATEVYYNENSADADYAAAAEALNTALADHDTSKATVDNGIYITGFNSVIGTGSSVIYTSDFNGGEITTATANHNWSYNVILTWDSTVGAYVVTEAAQGIGDSTPTYQLSEDMIMIAVHKDESSSESIANYDLLASAQVGQVLNTYGVDIDACSLSIAPYVTLSGEAEEDSDVPVVDESILYQLNDNSTDVRLVAYVDDLSAYSSVSFTLTIGDKVSNPLVCTTAYEGLYADGTLYTTEQIYGVDGYFVTYTINRYLDVYAGQEVTITVTYTTVTGETSTDVRTVTIGTAEEEPEPVTVTGNLTYANAYDWTNTTNNIYAFASSDSTATPLSVMGQSEGFMGWWNGVVLEYNSTNETWEVVSVNLADGSNEAETATLGDNRLVLIYHSEAATGQADAYNMLTSYATEGAEFTLNVDIATLQSASGTLSDVYLSYTY